jgi:ABC-type transport system substrate-binding protein
VFNQDVNIIDSLFNSTSPQNFLYYRNDEIDRRLDEYARANHPEMRDNIRKEMAKIIAEDVPYTFLYRIPKYAAYRNDSLGEVEIHPYYFFSFVDKWYMKPTSPKRR